jgi:hypothetical protein
MKGAETKLVDDVLHRITLLYQKDPLVRAAPDNFITQYNIREQYEDLLSYIKVLKHRIELHGGRVSDRPIDVDYDDPSAVRTLIGLSSPSDYVEKRPVFCISEGRTLKPVFHEMFVKEHALADIMLEGVAIDSNPLLPIAAKVLLERRLLATIPHLREPWPLPWALHLSLDTLLSAEFIKFHRDWRCRWGNERDLQPSFFVGVDDLRDIDRFTFARDYVCECGYDLCLDGVSPEQLTQLDLDELSFQSVRLELYLWEPHKDKVNKTRQELLHRWGADRVIFSKCDSIPQLDEAVALGANLVQGNAPEAIYSGAKEWAA